MAWTTTYGTKRSLLGAALGLAAGLGLIHPAAAADEPIKVRIGYQSLYAAGGEIAETLRHTNILELNGIEAEFRTFTFGGPLAEAAVAGDIDNVFAADAPVLRAMARLPGSKVLQFTHDARFGILVRPDFEGGLADLRGKTLSAPFGTTTFPRAMKAIIAAGVEKPFQDMTLVNQDVAEQTSAIQGKLVDGVTTWDPTLERLIQQKLAKPIWMAPRGENMGMQGFTGKWLEKYGEAGAVRFLKAWIMATWWTSNNIDQAHEWFGKTSRLPPDILKIASDFDRHLAKPIADIKTVDLTLTDSDIASTQGVMDFLLANKLLNAKIDAKSYFDMGPARKAQAEIAAGDFPDLAKIKVVTP
jgi:ABC-type nitrate/sulfonate/bicarbonate transport system substrate-binding protein